MEADKSILLQKQVRDNSEDLRNEYLDMKNWEEQMRKADAEIRNAGGDQILPPVRRKKKAAKESAKPIAKENNATESKRIKSSDYSAWEKFDAEKACEEAEREVHTEDEGEEPLSKEELEKNHAAATVHKAEGNNYVKREKWAEAVACYGKAIKTFPYDAVFFANRALCQLKMDNLYMAEADCTAAIQLDEFYVKAYHRRATARISLRQYESAARDVKTILKLEPSNGEAKVMLARVNKYLENSKPIISTTRDEAQQPEVAKTMEKKKPSETGSAEKTKKLEEIADERAIDGKDEGNVDKMEKIELTGSKVLSILPEWLPEVPDDVDVVEAITKLPHQRSKKPLRIVPIEEIEFDAKKRVVKDAPSDEKPDKSIAGDEKKECPQDSADDDVPEQPKTAVQFLLTWRRNTSTEFRYKYLKKIPAARMPAIFQDSMESNTFSEIINVLRREFIKREEAVFDYLRHLSEVKRFRTLTMFMSNSDRDDVRALFEHSKTFEGQSDDVVKRLVVKYEM